jgi:hypothetical protein
MEAGPNMLAGLVLLAGAVEAAGRFREELSADYQSAEAHLLYARVLEEGGRTDDALYEYQALANYYPGAEARVRYGLLLDKAGRQNEAKAVFNEVLTQLKRAPKYVRRVQAEWIALAEKALRG